MSALTDATTALLLIEPTPRDAQTIARHAHDQGCGLVAHPTTLHALHAAVVVYGPMIRRTTLAAVLDLTITPDPDLPAGLILLTPDTDPP